MLELIVNTKNNQKEIELLHDGELIEYYLEDKKEERKEGNIYVGVVKDILEGMQSAFVDIGTNKNGFIHLKDILPKVDIAAKNEIDEIQDIRRVVKYNQSLLVQVKKDSNDRKGAKVSTHINLPSKYVVLMPETGFVAVSQKIEDKDEANRLTEIAKKALTNNNGVVIRTAAVGKTDEIIEDKKNLENK